MLSITKFKKFMTCYFATVFVFFFLYVVVYHHGGSDGTKRRVINLDEDRLEPYVIDGSAAIDGIQDALMKKVNAELREIGVDGEEQNNTIEFDQQLPSDEDLEMMMDALHYDLPTHATGIEDPWNNASSTVTPDYFYRSIAFSETSTAAPVATDHLPADADFGEIDSRVEEFLGKANASQEATTDVVKALELENEEISYYDDDEETDDIPHIIHQTSTTRNVPKQVETCVPSWSKQHPFWLHWFWTESAFLEMLLQHFPDNSALYNKYTHEINRADMRKYFLIYKEGGVVADLDLESLRPLEEDLLAKQCILAREPFVHRELLYNVKSQIDLVTPAFMACRPGHPFFKYVIDNLKRFADKAKYLEWEDNVLNSTGTMFLSQVLAEYRSMPHEPSDAVYVAPSEMFMPTFDPGHEETFRVMCNGYKLDNSLTKTQKLACEQLTKSNFNFTDVEDAFSRHNWLGSWKSKFVPGDTLPITDIDQTITVFDR